jgi:predicted RNA binding protein YcfA (HicA-like mRNA interferase family)
VSLKPLSPRKVMKALGVLGFERVRQRGSHVVLKHPDGRITVVRFMAERTSALDCF